jgi:hypothetical protein
MSPPGLAPCRALRMGGPSCGKARRYAERGADRGESAALKEMSPGDCQLKNSSCMRSIIQAAI